MTSRSETIRRRLITVPRVVLLFLILTLATPALFVLGATVDAIRWIRRRRPWMTLRLLAFAWVFTGTEVVGIAGLAWSWLAAAFGTRRPALIDSAYRIQRWFARVNFAAVRVLFSISVNVENESAVVPGPMVAFVRHVSIVDNLLPPWLFSVRNGLRMRWVLKRELLDDPALDIAGSRLPNYFVDRNATRPHEEVRAIAGLAADLGPTDGIVIYPEGTRFTQRKRRARIERLARAESGDLDTAQRLQHTLLPKTGGPLALLDAGADIVFVAHRGLEGFAHLRDIWNGSMVGRTVDISIWRVPHSAVPAGEAERKRWLYGEWQCIDDWVSQAV